MAYLVDIRTIPVRSIIVNSPYKEGQRAAERGESPEDNPYEDEHLGAQWEEGYYAVSEPKQKIRRGKPEWN